VRNARLAGAMPKAHAGVGLFCAGLRNRGTLDCSTKLMGQHIPVTCWCDECGPIALAAPCETHSLAETLAEWGKRTGQMAMEVPGG
jgi:hypothetical protein